MTSRKTLFFKRIYSRGRGCGWGRTWSSILRFTPQIGTTARDHTLLGADVYINHNRQLAIQFHVFIWCFPALSQYFQAAHKTRTCVVSPLCLRTPEPFTSNCILVPNNAFFPHPLTSPLPALIITMVSSDQLFLCNFHMRNMSYLSLCTSLISCNNHLQFHPFWSHSSISLFPTE